MLITPETLLKFSSFQQLSEQQLQAMLGVGEVEMFQSMPGEKIIARGTNDNFSFFLVSGSLKLIAKDGQTAIIKADSDFCKTTHYTTEASAIRCCCGWAGLLT